ncbi:MAG: membrane integrity-associated transporter subunit PqiC [Nitrospirae bacterium]|nr:membrane integrity-associated transporter subunit PqiC [Nitrospirota bacterium]
MLKRVAVVILASFFVACSLAETKIYSLYVPRDQAAGDTRAALSLAIHIDSPRYLAQPYIAYRNSPYQLTISKYSKWDASPGDIVKDVLRDAFSSSGPFRDVRLSHAVPTGFYLLSVNLKKFELLETAEGPFGEMEFDAVLFSPDNKEIYHRTISKRPKLDDKTFVSLAKGLSKGLAEGVNEVKSGIAGAVPAL